MTASPSTLLAQDPRAGHTRRRFLQGSAAAAGAAAILPSWLAKAAAASSSPLAPDEGMVVVVTLRGGNDSLNTLVPLSGTVRGLYETLRGALGVLGTAALPLTDALGLNPALPKLAARYRAGRVSFVQGVGFPTSNLSHFSRMDQVMAGRATADLSTGWLGRFLDDAPNWDTGVAGLTVASGPRLVLEGARAKVPSITGASTMWGGSTAAWDVCAQDAVRAMATTSSGLGVLADEAAAVNLLALEGARELGGLYSTALPTAPLSRDLTLAARALNSDVGTRVVAVELNGFDTHAMQTTDHPKLLAQVDDAIEAFWATLSPALHHRVCMVVVSEFGRRPAGNDSQGTDHGSAGMAMVIGENVKGGITGAAPSLSALDEDGNLVPTVDFRSLYATVVSGWLRADDLAVLGATYPKLDLFAAAPGAARPA